MPAVKVFIVLLGLVLVIDVVWLNSQVVNLGRQIPLKLKTLEEQINFLAYQKDTREKQENTLTATGDSESTQEEQKTQVVAELVKPKTTSMAAGITREVFIPLGSGTTNSLDWADTGAQAYIDTSVYPSLQVAYLQASLKSNSGVVFARLVQKNENAVVPGSDISHNTTTSTLKTSGSALLSAGNKLYLVQIRSETGQDVFLENARLRLVLK